MATKLSKDGVTVEFVHVTPDLAREYLGRNVRNRNVRARTAGAYASDMQRDEWKLNGETIKFSKSGKLLDGQHRLLAIIEADVPADLIVVSGLPEDAQETIDGGIRRTFSDHLKMRGEKDTLVLAAVVRAVTFWERGLRSDRGNFTPTPSQMFAILDKHPELREAARFASNASGRCKMPPSVIGLTYWLFSQIDPEDSEAFFDFLVSGANLDRDNPIYKLRQQAVETPSGRGSRSSIYLTALTIKAWNAWRDGVSMQLLSWRRGGASPESFPEPH